MRTRVGLWSVGSLAVIALSTVVPSWASSAAPRPETAVAAAPGTSTASGTATAPGTGAGTWGRHRVTTDAAAAGITGTARYVAFATPQRFVDSRHGTGTAQAPIDAMSAREFAIAGGSVPTSATAVLLNVTAVEAKGTGWLQVFPTGRAAIGSSSTLNLDPALDVLPNAAFAALGDGGRITIYTTFTTDVLIDVFGYFEPAATATGGRFVPLTPSRLLDTRPPEPPAAAPGPPVTAPAPTTAPPTTVAPRPSNPGNTENCGDFATYAQAYAWYITYFPYYGDVAQLDADHDGIPCESLPGAPSRVTSGVTTHLTVAGHGGVPPSGVSAVVLNVTAVEPTSSGYVQVAPTPVTVGATSNLNTTAGVTTANLVVVPLGTAGQIDLYTTASTELLVDVMGYFTDTGAPSSSSGLFVPIRPDRRLDTRAGGAPRRAGRTTIPVDVTPIDPTAAAIAGNLTATGADQDGWIQLAAAPIRPGASSNLNVDRADQTIANAVVSPVAGGRLEVYTYGPAHLLLDVTGWFTSDATVVTDLVPAPAATTTTVAATTTSAPDTTPATTTTTTMPSTSTSVPTAAVALAEQRLAALATNDTSPPVAYVRASWNEGIDADGDCIRTRHEVLLSEADGPVTMSADGCSVVSGAWDDPYTGARLTLATQIEIDHLVALANAHFSGGWAWTAQQKQAYANDLDHPETLIAVSSAANQAKSDSTPDEWLPATVGYRCEYAVDWVAVKATWLLTVTTNERATLDTLLAAC